MLERVFQAEVIKDVKELLPGCMILKLDTGYIQGIPDLLILWRNRWGVLEVKGSRDAPEQPNQRFYVDDMNEMSFAAFIYPENKEDVLDALQRSFRSTRSARLPQRV